MKAGMGAAMASAMLLAATILAGGCGASPETDGAAPKAPEKLPNVVIILVDTLRADHLGTYGYERDTSPNIDAFAAENIVFERHYAQATCTFPSSNAVLTGRYVHHFLGQPEGGMGIPEGIQSIAEILKAKGYSTGAVSASAVVRKNPSRFNPQGGYDRGFDHFVEECEWKSAICMNRTMRMLTKQLQEPYFVYLHYIDPHGHYQPPQQHEFRFVRPYDGPEYIQKGDPNPISQRIYKERTDPGVSERDMEHLVDLYDEEIAFLDDRFPRMLQILDEAGGLDDTLIAFVADHGEEFLEHGHVKHCRTPYDTLAQTPLILKLPGGPQGMRVDIPSQNIDVVPTILDYLGDDPGAYGFEGESLRAVIEGEHEGPRHAFSSQSVWRMVTDGRHKLLFNVEQKKFQLYDLVKDPGELTDILRDEPEVFRRLRKELFQWLTTVEGGISAGADATKEAEEQLRALGYIQ